MRYYFLLLACAYLMGALSACITFMMLRERLIERAIDEREQEVYGPLLERVQQQDAAVQRRRELECQAKADRPAANIRLDEVARAPRRHRGGRR